VDLTYDTAGSVVQGHEGGTKTVRSNREIHLHDNVVMVLRDEIPSAAEREPKRISVYHTGRYAHRRKQLLQAGMAADPESKEDPTAAVLQHAPQLREFSLLDRSEIRLHFSVRPEIASRR
jgi:hypothetical protein